MTSGEVRSRYARRAVLVLASLALSWAAAVALTGGLVVRTPWGLVSSRRPARPFLFGAAAAALYAACCRRHATSDVAPLGRLPWPTIVGVAASAGALGCGIHWSSFLAAGPDASGYVSQAGLWLRGTPWFPVPEWAAAAEWPGAAASAAPIGYRPGAHDRLVPTYPPGLPLLMAAFQAVGGETAVFLVVPLLGAAAVWATCGLARRLAGARAGAIAGALLASSPAFLIMLVQPMSDVPAAACWAIATLGALRGRVAGAAAAGLASGAALLIRPNLAPLTGVLAVMIAARASTPRGRVMLPLVCAAAAAPAVLVLAVVNARFFGSPFESGYGSVANLYAAAEVLPNLRLYGSALLETQTPAILVGLVLPFVMSRRDGAWWAAVFLGIVFPVAVLLLYLPYERVKVWWFLRFLLPAYPAMLAACAGALVILASRLARPRLAWALVLITGTLVAHGLFRAAEGGVFTIKRTDQRYAAASSYARMLPARSVFISEVHNGTLHHYTGRDVLRWKVIDPRYIDRAVSELRRRGYAVYVIADEFEMDSFRERFGGARILDDVRPELAVRVGRFVRVYPVSGSSLR